MSGALITASTSSSLAKLDLKVRFFVSNGVYFKIADLTKCSRLEHPGQKIFFASFPPDRRLCFCTYLKVYIERTKASLIQQNLALKILCVCPILSLMDQSLQPPWPDG